MAKKDKDDKPSLQDDIETALLLKEADEALRQERLEALWREWGSTIIGVAVMLVFGTMIGVGWQSWRTSVYEDETARIITTAQSSNPVQAADNTEYSGHYGGIASLLAAAELAAPKAQQSEDNAKRLYNLMAEADEAGLPRQYDILAQWGALRTRAGIEQDTETQISIAEEMMDLADKRGNPYQPLIMIEAAILYGENDQPNRAVEILDGVSTMDIANNNDDITETVAQLTRLYETQLTLSSNGDENE